MISNHSDENHEDIEMHNLTIQDGAEEEPGTYSVTFDDAMNDASDNEPCSNDEANNDEIFHQTPHDVINSLAQSLSLDIKQISTALALFRHRHKLSKACLNDLCDLLRCLGVANVPADFRAIERNILENHESVLKGKKYFICSTCGNKGVNSSKCENVKCQSSTSFKEAPTTLCSFKLLPQITSILERHKLLPEVHDNDSSITDVRDAQVCLLETSLLYSNLQTKPEKQYCLSRKTWHTREKRRNAWSYEHVKACRITCL